MWAGVVVVGMEADGRGSGLDGEGEEVYGRDVELVALSKEDSVRERESMRFATPPEPCLDGLGEKRKRAERSLAGFFGESVASRVGWAVRGFGFFAGSSVSPCSEWSRLRA